VPSPLALPNERASRIAIGGLAGVRRFLIATGTADYPTMPDHNLPSVAVDLERIVAVLAGKLGYRRVNTLGLNPTGDALRLELSRFFRDPDRRPDDLVVVYYAGHGEILGVDEHVLLPTDADPAHAKATSVATADLAQLMLEGTVVRRVLVILDTCYAGAGADNLAVRAFASLSRPAAGEVERPGVVLLTATRPREVAKPGVFAAAFANAIDDLATGAYAPPDLAVGAVVGVLNRYLPRSQRARIHVIGALGEPPPFLPNPRYQARLTGLDLDTQRWLREQRSQDLRTHFEPRARGVELETEPGSLFTGRRQALTELATWLTDLANDARARIITGDPGSGKSAVLGRLVMLADPEYRPSVPLRDVAPETIPPAEVIDAVIHARNRTTEELLRTLVASAGVQAENVDELLVALSTLKQPLLVVLDALDEAVDPVRTATDLLGPLVRATAEGGQVRLLVGTRRHLVPELIRGLDRAVVVLDLDTAAYLEQADVVEYARRCLLETTPGSPYRHVPSAVLTGVANAIASAASQAFLVARIVSRSLAREHTAADPADPVWRANLPSSVGAAMEDYLHRFGVDEQRVRDLLLPVAYAEGAGLPWEDLWAPLATAIAGRPYNDEDLRWLRRQAGAYIVEGLADGRSAYRLYHEALADHLRRHDPHATAEIQRRITRILVEHVSSTADADETGRDWGRAHPYIRAHLATHAAAAGELDELLADPRFLLNAEPVRLLTAALANQSKALRPYVAAYLRAFHHLHSKPPIDHAAYLELAARCEGATELADRIVKWGLIRPWSARWAQWRPAMPHRLLGRHRSSVNAVAMAEFEGRPVVVSGSDDRTVRVWNLATGALIGGPVTGHEGAVNAVAMAEFEGRPVVVSGSDDRTVRVWDLRDGQQFTELTGHTGDVNAVAIGEVNGRPVVVSGSDDRTVRVWNLATGALIGGPLTGHEGAVNAVAMAEFEGRPVVVSGSDDWKVRVWDSRNGAIIDLPFTGHTGPISALAVAHIRGQPVVITGSVDRTIRVWDLGTGTPIGMPFMGHTDRISGITVTELNGRHVIVSASDDGTLQVWDLRYGFAAGAPFTGHTGRILAVAMAELDGRGIIISGSDDRTVRGWDLQSSTAVGTPFTGHSGGVNALAMTRLDGRAVVLSASGDETVRVWDLQGGGAVGRPFTGHSGGVNALAMTRLDGRPVVLSASNDRTVRAWDVASGWPIAIFITGHIAPIRAIAAADLEGRRIIISGSDDRTLRVWDLLTGVPIGGPLTGHEGAVNAVTTAEFEGRPVVVSGSSDWTLRVWDVATGEPIGSPLTGHSGGINALAVTELEGRLVVLSAGGDATVRVWDLTTAKPIGVRLMGYGQMLGIAVAEIEGKRVAISGSSDWTVRVWDLATGALIDRPLTGHYGAVKALALGDLDGQPLLVSGGDDRIVRLRHLATGAPIGTPLTGYGWILGVAIAELDRRTVVFTAHTDGTVRFWDGATGAPIGTLSTAHRGAVNAVTVGELYGRPILISAGDDWTVAAWDLTFNAPIGRIRTAHQGAINTVTVAKRDRRPVIITGSDDGRVRIWNLATGARIGGPLIGHDGAVITVTTGELDGRPVVISGSTDGTVRIWDRIGGYRVWRGRVLRGPRRPRGRVVLRVNDAIYMIRFIFDQSAPSIICNYGDGTVGRFDLRTGSADWIIDFDVPITSMALGPDSTLIVAGAQGLVAVETDRTPHIPHV